MNFVVKIGVRLVGKDTSRSSCLLLGSSLGVATAPTPTPPATPLTPFADPVPLVDSADFRDVFTSHTLTVQSELPETSTFDSAEKDRL